MADDGSLERLAFIADESGLVHFADEARSLIRKVGAGRFYVACVGQFKRGKSSLLDALIGEPLIGSAATQTLTRVRMTKAAGEDAVVAEAARITDLEEELRALFPGEIAGDRLPGTGDIE